MILVCAEFFTGVYSIPYRRGICNNAFFENFSQVMRISAVTFGVKLLRKTNNGIDKRDILFRTVVKVGHDDD